MTPRVEDETWYKYTLIIIIIIITYYIVVLDIIWEKLTKCEGADKGQWRIVCNTEIVDKKKKKLYELARVRVRARERERVSEWVRGLKERNMGRGKKNLSH